MLKVKLQIKKGKQLKHLMFSGDFPCKDDLEYQIIEILRLGELNIFKEENRWLKISTCIFTTEKNKPYQGIRVTKNVPRNITKQLKIKKDQLSKTIFRVDQKNLSKEKWVLSPFLKNLQKITEKTRI